MSELLAARYCADTPESAFDTKHTNAKTAILLANELESRSVSRLRQSAKSRVGHLLADAIAHASYVVSELYVSIGGYAAPQ